MNIAHPTLQARDIASLIDNDPIMASQIKGFMREDRLVECLGIRPKANLDEFKTWELREEIRAREEAED